MGDWKRSELETFAVVAALDATSTVLDAAVQLGCSPGTVHSLASWRPEVRQAREQQSQRRQIREDEEAVAALDATETLSEAARALGITTYRLVGLIQHRPQLWAARNRQEERGASRIRTARIGVRALRQLEAEKAGQQRLFTADEAEGE